MFHLAQSIGVAAATAAARGKAKPFGNVALRDDTVCFEASLYPDLNLAIDIHLTSNGRPVEPYASLTVRGPGWIALGVDEVLVKARDENELMREPMLASRNFRDTGRREHLNFSEFEVWQIAPVFVRSFVEAFPHFNVPPMYFCPPVCYAVNPHSSNKRQVVEIRRGHRALVYAEEASTADAEAVASELNGVLGVTRFDQEAMINGVLMGWDAPEVNPEYIQFNSAQ